MRFLLLCACVFLLVPSVAIPQAGTHARPPGIATADTMANAPLEAPSKAGVRSVNIEQVNAETQELRRLADGLPPQIDQIGKGQLPKDLVENLKKIEKLAKHIRGEITP
ncbi:MAG: hypothetical protein WAN14_21325 [Candidatus Acidiferrales bacterium]